MLFDVRLFWFELKKKKKTLQEDNFSHASGVSPPLHCVTSGQQSCFSDFRAYSFSLFAIFALLAITMCDSILAIDVSILWIVQNVHLLCILISTHLLHFMTAEIASILRQCFDLVNYSLSSVGGLNASSSLF